jgi:hypothetical protein
MQINHMRFSSMGWLAVLAVLWSCGGSTEPEPGRADTSTGSERPRRGAEEDDMQVEGLMGVIPSHIVEERLMRRQGRFVSCWTRNTAEVEFLAGRLELYFHVDREGRVAWVYPRSSSIGHRATERCMLDVARETSFPKPRGGPQAEFAWSLELPPPEDVRPPVTWESSRVKEVIDAQRDALAGCAPPAELGLYTLTAYVAPGGQVSAAGVSATTLAPEETMDCLIQQVHAWALPDPGSYHAKVSFRLE